MDNGNTKKRIDFLSFQGREFHFEGELDGEGNAVDMDIFDIQIGAAKENYHDVFMKTNRGDVEAKYYPVMNTTKGVIFAGGEEGDFSSPANDLYERLASMLLHDGIASYWVRFRHPSVLDECILDMLSGLLYLRDNGIVSEVFVGYGLGATVSIDTAVGNEDVVGIVGIASQCEGSLDVVKQLPTSCALLLLHGKQDALIPYSCSEKLFQEAHGPKNMFLYENAAHSLNDVAGDLTVTSHNWIKERLDQL